MSAVLLLSVMTINSPVLTNLSPSYSYYPADYRDDYYYYDQPPHPPMRTVLVNESFTVDCLGMLDKKDQVELVHNGQEMTEYQLEERIVDDESVHSVLVPRASLSDSGRWSCGGSDYSIGVIPAVDMLTLLVDEVPLSNNSVLTVTEGSTLHPVCAFIQSQGHQESLGQVSWSLGDSPVNQDTEQVDSLDREGRKHIISSMDSMRVDRMHSGSTLACSLHGQRVCMELVVEYQPEFTITREPGFGSPVLSQMVVTLGCLVEASPASMPYWERNGVRVSTTSLLTFSNVSTSDEGWYQCSTNHKLGNFSSVGYFLSVKEGFTHHPAPTTSGQVIFMEAQETSRNYNTSQPFIIPSTRHVTAQAGQAVTLSARFCSNPQPSVVLWAGPQVLLRQGEERGRFSTDHPPDLHGDMCGAVSLHIIQVQLEDRGEYLMVVRNIYGIQEGVIWLEVEGEQVSSSLHRNCDILTLLLLCSIIELLQVKI